MLAKTNKQSEYNERFCAMVAKHCPNLFAEIAEKEYEGTVYLEATITHPDDKRVIRLSTYGRELTPFIHTHHCHFDQFTDDDHEEEFENTVKWICDVMNDKVFVCTQYDGDRIVSSMSTPDQNDLMPRSNNRLEVLTYSGGVKTPAQNNG
ncbi:MAG: hypothetical protein GX811_10330 [Lentisphaerae bacterium]|nr:hypothetical protein [Lentisphaerota bacterium]